MLSLTVPNILAEASHYYNISDKATWYKDEACTIVATEPNEVTWLRNKGTNNKQSLGIKGVAYDAELDMWYVYVTTQE
jgi:uncharacterized protein (DUF927 family)